MLKAFKCYGYGTAVLDSEDMNTGLVVKTYRVVKVRWAFNNGNI